MTKKIKKSVSILLALVMLCGVLAVAPVAVGAEEYPIYTTRDGRGEYTLKPDESDPDLLEFHLVSGVFENFNFYAELNKTFGGSDVYSRINSITSDKVIFKGSCRNMFMSWNCERIDLSNVNTDDVNDMGQMFRGCGRLKSIDISNFHTSNVTDMINMFLGDTNLSSLDLSSFDMSLVRSTYAMFCECNNLKEVKFSNDIVTSNVEDMRMMFFGCSSLTSLDLSGFDMSKAQNQSGNMFHGCSNLKELTISNKFTGGIISGMSLNNAEYNENSQKYNGWRVEGDPKANKVSGDGAYAVIEQPADETTYKWIEYGTVTWNNWDNSTLDTEDYKLETTINPTYKGETPNKPDSAGKFYTFAGWTDGETEYGLNAELPIVTGNITYTAIFTESLPYTLNYIYQGRSGGNKGGYVGDDDDTDIKTYTVTVELGASDLEESGMPKAKVLVDNAPVVNDPYKNCRWTFTDEYVRFDSENKVVTITANQPERLYRVELKNSDNSLIYTTRVKLNSIVKENDSFITVPKTDGSGQPFAYWSVVQNGKETARCFERKFNLRVTGDSVVTAHYGEAENLVTLSEAEISRQKFTENGTTKDLLYADFITAYMNKQGMELSTKGSSEYKTGVIVQYSPDVKVAKENAPGETLSENDKIKFASGDELTAADAKTIAKGGTVSGGKYSYLNATIDNSKYNDKNRLNKSLVFTNTETARRLVLCAYYYVYNVKTDEIEMTAPVYFYLYDAGNAVNTES